jgi:hypothetical protein
MKCSSRAIDLTGRIFDMLTVLKYAGANKHGMSTWLCRCKCGKCSTVVGKDLRKGNTTSCGCKRHRHQFTDITGQQFGDLTVLNYAFTHKNKRAMFKCLCTCGKTTTKDGHLLRSGATKSCGCKRHQVKDILHQVFGRLTVIKFAGRTKRHKAQWLCKCTCGKTKVVHSASLVQGLVKSCGCWLEDNLHNGDLGRQSAQWTTTHGHTSKGITTREYRSWDSMKSRCLRVNHISWKNYGGRGVRICTRWLNSFEAFLEDLGRRPKGKTLDRINPNGHYVPSNIRWATPKQQIHNRRSSKGEPVVTFVDVK